MGCTNAVTLGGITYDCTDVPYGGLKEILIANKSDLGQAISVDESTGVVTVGTPDAGTVVSLDFSNKDAFSNWTETKTVDPTGSVKVEENISVEFPKMTADKRLELEKMANPYAQLVAFVHDSADEYHMVGFEFGLYPSEIQGQTGTGRSDKNVYQLKLTGEETHLAYSITATDWDMLTATQ